MAAKYLIIILTGWLVGQAQSSSYTTFASNYNSHSINHAVVYPVSGSKFVVPRIATPPVPAPTVPAANAAPIPVDAPPQIPSIVQTATIPSAASAPVPLAAAGHIAFAATPYRFVTAEKVGFHAASPVLVGNGVSYDNGPVHTVSPAYAPSYTGSAAYTPTFIASSDYATAPPYAGSSSLAATNTYPAGPVHFASGSSIVFASDIAVAPAHFPSAPELAKVPSTATVVSTGSPYFPW